MREPHNERSGCSHPHGYEEASRLKRILWSTAGTISLALGTVGIVVPMMPTTPFLLLAAACYLRGSRRMYDWLMQSRLFGKYLLDYMEGRGIPTKTKVLAIGFLWSAIGFSVVFVTESLLLRCVLVAVAVGVTVHIAMIRPKHSSA